MPLTLNNYEILSMKTLLLGATSPIGQSFAKRASKRGLSLIAINNAQETENYEKLNALNNVTQVTLDLSKKQAIQEFCFREWPDVLINCYQATSDEESMPLINTQLPEFLSQLTHHLGIRLIHLSSPIIFDGSQKQAYRPTDKANPQCYHGQTLLLGEKAILKNSDSKPVILRVPHSLSPPDALGQDSFNQRVLQMARTGQKLSFSKKHICQPTSCHNVADVLVELSERKDLHGIYHWAGTETISEYALAQTLLERAQIPHSEDLLEASSSEEAEKNFSMELQPLRNKLKTPALNLKELFRELDFIEPLSTA